MRNGVPIALLTVLFHAAAAQSIPRPDSPWTLPAERPPELRPPDDSGKGRGRDSVELRLAEIRVKQAELECAAAAWWRRCFPRLTFTAGIGASESFTTDESAGVRQLLPRETYRLTLSVPLHELFDSGRERMARTRLEESRAQLAHVRLRQASEERENGRRAGADADELRLLREEHDLLTRLVRYFEVQFDAGEIRFDTLLRARLQLLNSKAKILRLEHGLRPGTDDR